MVGTALAAPLIVAFADYLPYGYTGGHSEAVAHASLPTAGLSQLVLPYSLGPIFGFRSATGLPDVISGTWAYVGGFLMVTVIAAGLVGLFGSRLRPLRIGLAAWIGLCLLRTFGFPPVVHLLATVPGLRLTAFYRYSDPSWELAAVVLAALGLDDLARGHRARAELIGSAAVAGGLAVWAAVSAFGVMGRAVQTSGHAGGHPRAYPIFSLIGALALLVVLVVGGFLAGGPAGRSAGGGSGSPAGRRLGRMVMAGAVGLEAVLLLGFTYLSAPPPTALQTGSVQWLQAHLGSFRFVTLGPIQPNYGSYYGIAQANINDLPVPKAWNRYIEGHLDPNALPAVFSGGGRINPEGPTPAQELAANLPAYEAAAVRYVVEASDGLDVQGQPFPAAAPARSRPGPRLVYRDDFAEIWQLPSPAPSFSLATVSSGRTRSTPVNAQGCGVTWSGWDDAFVHCAQRTVLTRRVQSMPGWTASAEGRRLPVSVDTGTPAGLFQQTLVPAGVTHVRFRFVPPHEGWALVLAALAALTVVLSFLWDPSPRRPRKGG